MHKGGEEGGGGGGGMVDRINGYDMVGMMGGWLY